MRDRIAARARNDGPGSVRACGSALDAHAEQHRGGVVGKGRLGRDLPVLAHGRVQLPFAGQLVDRADGCEPAVILQPGARIDVVAVTALEDADQPIAERMIDLEREIAAELPGSGC